MPDVRPKKFADKAMRRARRLKPMKRGMSSLIVGELVVGGVVVVGVEGRERGGGEGVVRAEGIFSSELEEEEEGEEEDEEGEEEEGEEEEEEEGMQLSRRVEMTVCPCVCFVASSKRGKEWGVG